MNPSLQPIYKKTTNQANDKNKLSIKNFSKTCPNLFQTDNILVFEKEAKKVHGENLKYAPHLAANTVLCHIAAPLTLPDGQQGILNRLDSGMRGREYSEKMLELKTDSSKDFIEQVKDTIQRAKEIYKEIYSCRTGIIDSTWDPR